MSKHYTIAMTILAGAFAANAAAQEGEPKRDVFFQTVQPPASAEAGINTFQFVAHEAILPGKVVKGAPYSASAVTETVQTLSDGNRITETVSSFVARDSEGRTRREQSLPAIGPWASQGPAQKLVTINDPVSGVSYMLDNHTARKLQMPDPAGLTAQKLRYERMVRVEGQGAAPPPDAGPMVVIRKSTVSGSKSEAEGRKEENLGQTTMEGVMADGVRTTTVLPAGSIGNERPITITDERWFSPELQTTVLSRHSDPRVGETTFRLTNISRSEPPASLFQVPPDYQIIDKDTVETKIEKK